jgi:hypothetical protein
MKQPDCLPLSYKLKDTCHRLQAITKGRRKRSNEAKSPFVR